MYYYFILYIQQMADYDGLLASKVFNSFRIKFSDSRHIFMKWETLTSSGGTLTCNLFNLSFQRSKNVQSVADVNANKRA